MPGRTQVQVDLGMNFLGGPRNIIHDGQLQNMSKHHRTTSKSDTLREGTQWHQNAAELSSDSWSGLPAGVPKGEIGRDAEIVEAITGLE